MTDSKTTTVSITNFANNVVGINTSIQNTALASTKKANSLAATNINQNDTNNIHHFNLDKTNYTQSLMHMIKGNLGTGILSMPSTFALCTLTYGCISLPILCLIATCCVHLLVRSSQHIQNKIKLNNIDYAELAKGSFKAGPAWLRSQSSIMCCFVDTILIISQIGICCVYIVFVVDNLAECLISFGFKDFNIVLIYFFTLAIIMPVSNIRTLRTLSLVSGFANILQVVSILTLFYLLTVPEPATQLNQQNYHQPQQYQHLNSYQKTNFTSILPPVAEALIINSTNSRNNDEFSWERMARGFGAAMFAFEGISVVLPVYSRMKKQDRMGGSFGIINVSYSILLVLYMLVGVLGCLKYGNDAKGSITQNLKSHGILPDIVRFLVSIAILLSYPLQFYVPAEIIWNWSRNTFLENKKPSLKRTNKLQPSSNIVHEKYYVSQQIACRTILVLITFFLAVTIKKLRLLMELVGAISGTALSIIIPAIIHLATFYEDTSGLSRILMLIMDIFFIVIGIAASAGGSIFSVMEIIKTWDN